MRLQHLIQTLVEQHGAIVRTEHHLQLPAGNGMHDVWIGKAGLKWKWYGHRDTESGSPELLLKGLNKYQPDNTDLAWMQRLNAFLKKIEGLTGIFVDAGFKKGVAQLAMVKCLGKGNADIMVRQILATNINEAEKKAVELAQQQWPGEVVHTDSQFAAEATGAVWLPRKQNKLADAIGNKRG